MGDLSENFSRHEFACKCGCGNDTVDAELIRVLQSVRARFGKPIRFLALLALAGCASGPLTPEQSARVDARVAGYIAAAEQAVEVIRANHGDAVRPDPKVAAAARTACAVGLIMGGARGASPALLTSLARACALLDSVLAVPLPPRKPT